MTNAQALIEVQTELAAVSASILSLLGKTSQSVSFGDQSYGLVDVQKLMKVRNELRERERILEGRMAGTPRRTIKISFPRC